MPDSIEVIGDIAEVETISVGRSIRELSRLQRNYGSGRWKKMKGKATIRLPDGMICNAELHRYEAHGIGRRDIKVERILS